MTSLSHYDLMIEYLKQKVELKYWHAVWDAAIDLKCIEERGQAAAPGARTATLG